MERKDIHTILRRYIDGSCTDEERAWVEHWYNQLGAGTESTPPADDIERDIKMVRRRLHQQTNRERRPWATVAAAVVMLAVGIGLIAYTMIRQAGKEPAYASAGISMHDVPPGANRAVLRLADGRHIELSSEQNELIIGANEVAYGDGSIIAKSDDGGNSSSESPQMLLLTTPNGGQYQVTLPDGTKVWMNAASSLIYPMVFAGPTRKVELVGEAYFDVAKSVDAKGDLIPFIVKSASHWVEVLGTRFNVNDYPDDDGVHTALVEGSVRIFTEDAKGGQLLSPGEQASVSNGRIEVRQADIESITAWTNGDFVFNQEDLHSVMKKIARWYDVEIIYPKEHSDTRFSGVISRSRNLSAVLQMMELTGEVTFKIAGRRVIIMG